MQVYWKKLSDINFFKNELSVECISTNVDASDFRDCFRQSLGWLDKKHLSSSKFNTTCVFFFSHCYLTYSIQKNRLWCSIAGKLKKKTKERNLVGWLWWKWKNHIIFHLYMSHVLFSFLASPFVMVLNWCCGPGSRLLLQVFHFNIVLSNLKCNVNCDPCVKEKSLQGN